MYVIFAPLKRDKNHMVSQMAHAKILGEPFMAHLENLYNITGLILVHINIYGNFFQYTHKNV